MKPLPERFNDALEQQLAARRAQKRPEDQDQVLPTGNDPEVEKLLALARRLQTAPPLQVDQEFARRLEGRLRAHQAAQHLARSEPKKAFWWFQGPVLRTAFILATVIICIILLGTGVMITAAQATNPSNPLYIVRQWEQGIQQATPTAITNQAEQERQGVLDQLHTLSGLAKPAQTAAYNQGIIVLDQKLIHLTLTINALPGGPEQQRMLSELRTLKTTVNATLRGFLPQLAIAERLTTTDELSQLGDQVPELTNAAMVVSMSPKEQATVSLAGKNLVPEARLLIDDQLATADASIQNGIHVFVVDWSGQQAPATLGIMNPDGTATHTKTITFTILHNNDNDTTGSNTNTNKNNNTGSNANNNGNTSKNDTGTSKNGKKGKGTGGSNGTATPGLPTLPTIPTIPPIPTLIPTLIPTISIKL